MHISKINISGYKGIEGPFEISFHKGLNVLVGENATGKTTIIDALRLLMREDEFGYSPVLDTHFFKAMKPDSEPAKKIAIQCDFDDLSDEEKIIFLPWTDAKGGGSLTVEIENKELRGHYRKSIWAGASKSSIFEWELFDRFNCIYLPPLRDAESKLKNGKTSRLARLLKTTEKKAIKDANEKGEKHPLEQQFKDFSDSISGDEDSAISRANQLIKTKLKEAVGGIFAQDTTIQFTEVNFSRIVESLRLLYFPNLHGKTDITNFRLLEENSLGYNNLLYLATVLAELTEEDEKNDSIKLLLIEEPEAHLHPQLQVRLLKYLQDISNKNSIQIIVTSHSPVLASSTGITSLIHISNTSDNYLAIPIRKTGLDKNESLEFVNRWLDTTKSTLIFAKSVILVEGIAEAFIIPEMAKSVIKKYNQKHETNLPETLEDGGISVINMNGIYFKHFMQLFCNVHESLKDNMSIPIRCAGITDLDPPKTEIVDKEKVAIIPTPSKIRVGTNHAINLCSYINRSENCRLFVSPLKTLEYDLAFEKGNLSVMAKLLHDNWPTDADVKSELKCIYETDWEKETEEKIGKAALVVLKRIEDNNMGKGAFSQFLAVEISGGAQFTVPDYIEKAIIWAAGGIE